MCFSYCCPFLPAPVHMQFSLLASLNTGSSPPHLPPDALESFQFRGASQLLLYLPSSNHPILSMLFLSSRAFPITPPHLSYIQLTGDGDNSLILKKLQSVLSDPPSQNLEKCSHFGTGDVLWCLGLARDTFSIKAVLLNYGLIGFYTLTWEATLFLCIIAPIGSICTNSYKWDYCIFNLHQVKDHCHHSFTN